MDVDEKKAARMAAHNGKTYFCCNATKAEFEKVPEQYLKI